MEPLYNTLNSSKTVSLAVPLPDNVIPGASYKVAIYRSGAWEELDGRIGEQAVYTEVSGDLGPMILVQKPSQSVHYFDNSVYSNQQVTRLEIDLMLKRSASTVTPPGTFTLNYTDYSVNPSGTNEIIYTNFERLTDSTLVAKGNYTIYGRIVINSASISISSPDNVSYSVSSYYDLHRGQSLLISNEKTISEMKGNANIPDKLVFSYGGNNLTFEYTNLSGEGQIRKSSAGNYYYNYYLKDHLGSTRMVINDAGYVTDAIMYQPYGTMEEVAGIATPGVDPERERFTGKEFDREGRDSANGIPGLNAYYFGARFHDPEIGMWMSTDPEDQFWNTYNYGPNDPLNGYDNKGGEWKKKIFDFIVNQISKKIAAKEFKHHNNLQKIVLEANEAHFSELEKRIWNNDNIDIIEKGIAIKALRIEKEQLVSKIIYQIDMNVGIGDYNMLKLIMAIPESIKTGRAGDCADLGGIVIPGDPTIFTEGTVTPGSIDEMTVTHN